MNIRFTKRFVAAYRSLEAQTRIRVDKALALLEENPRHPSLRLRRMRRNHEVWEVRADRHHGMTFEIHQGYYLMRNVGKHDETLESP
jgi:mRNA interferase RelE/StbE